MHAWASSSVAAKSFGLIGQICLFAREKFKRKKKEECELNAANLSSEITCMSNFIKEQVSPKNLLNKTFDDFYFSGV